MHPDFETKIGGKKCVLYTGVYGMFTVYLWQSYTCTGRPFPLKTDTMVQFDHSFVCLHELSIAISYKNGRSCGIVYDKYALFNWLWVLLLMQSYG